MVRLEHTFVTTRPRLLLAGGYFFGFETCGSVRPSVGMSVSMTLCGSVPQNDPISHKDPNVAPLHVGA